MTTFTITINTENVEQVDIPRFTEIVTALIRSGGLSGVKSGKTIIHFDPEGNFMGIQLDYFPFKRRKPA
jgi:hypothetical protein